MSNMLEQAILDAEALKEVALKNAETAVLDKYSKQIKEAVEQLLEQPEDEEMMPPVGDMSTPPEDLGGLDSVVDQIPAASMEGEEACPCPDEGEVIELNLDQLEKAIGGSEEDPLAALEEEEYGSESALFEALEEAGVSLEEEFELDEDHLKDLVEKLTVDISPQKSGWAGTPESEYKLAEEELLALEQDSKVREEKAAMRKAVEDLQKLKEGLENELSSVKEQNSKLAHAVRVLKENFDKVNLSNARLLYTNKAINSVSLNERQKNKIVESISKAETVEEAKVIYETLQNAVGSTNKPKQPESLSEVLKKDATSTILMSRIAKQETNSNDPSLKRWKALAGLNNN